jgi:hypothetical protein
MRDSWMFVVLLASLPPAQGLTSLATKSNSWQGQEVQSGVD